MTEYTDEYVKSALFDQTCQARQVDDLDRPALEAIEREVDAKFDRWLATRQPSEPDHTDGSQ